jgi:hypothetical protein
MRDAAVLFTSPGGRDFSQKWAEWANKGRDKLPPWDEELLCYIIPCQQTSLLNVAKAAGHTIERVTTVMRSGHTTEERYMRRMLRIRVSDFQLPCRVRPRRPLTWV